MDILFITAFIIIAIVAFIWAFEKVKEEKKIQFK